MNSKYKNFDDNDSNTDLSEFENFYYDKMINMLPSYKKHNNNKFQRKINRKFAVKKFSEYHDSLLVINSNIRHPPDPYPNPIKNHPEFNTRHVQPFKPVKITPTMDILLKWIDQLGDIYDEFCFSKNLLQEDWCLFSDVKTLCYYLNKYAELHDSTFLEHIGSNFWEFRDLLSKREQKNLDTKRPDYKFVTNKVRKFIAGCVVNYDGKVNSENMSLLIKSNYNDMHFLSASGTKGYYEKNLDTVIFKKESLFKGFFKDLLKLVLIQERKLEKFEKRFMRATKGFDPKTIFYLMSGYGVMDLVNSENWRYFIQGSISYKQNYQEGTDSISGRNNASLENIENRKKIDIGFNRIKPCYQNFVVFENIQNYFSSK